MKKNLTKFAFTVYAAFTCATVYADPCPKTVDDSFEWFSERPKHMKANKIVDKEGLVKARFLDLGTDKVMDEDLQYLCPLKNLEDLGLYQDFVGFNLTGKTLGFLTSLPKLTFLDLDGNKIKATYLKNLCGLDSLETIKLYNNPLGGEGLGGLSCLPSLKTLIFQGSKKHALTSADLFEISAYKDHPTLHHLDFTGNRISDDGLVHLSGLSIKSLSLLGNQLKTGATLGYLAELPNLEVLNLSNNWAYSKNWNELQPENLVHLAKSRTLTKLVLDSLKLGSIPGLSKIPNLNEVYLRYNDLVAEDLRGFLDYETFKFISIGEEVAESDHEVIQAIKKKFGEDSIK